MKVLLEEMPYTLAFFVMSLVLWAAGLLYGSVLALHVSAFVGFVALLIGVVLEGR
jgi:hypothetical protein